MKRSEIIHWIKKFNYKQCPPEHLKLTLKYSWNEREMLKTPNLSLHDLLRSLRNQQNKNKQINDSKN